MDESQSKGPGKKSFSLLTVILLFTIAAIGLSHVQTTHKLQQLEKENQRLKDLHQKQSDSAKSELPSNESEP